MNLNPFNSPKSKFSSLDLLKDKSKSSESYYTLIRDKSVQRSPFEKPRNLNFKSHENLMISLNNRMFDKYSSSQDYYFSRDINDILANSITPAAINWNDIECYVELDEYLKRPYQTEEYSDRICLLCEYYKFHKDIPRLFSLPTSKIMNYYHDKKRKLEYKKITKMLLEEAKKNNKKVAMNDEDNEIRLTDDEGNELNSNICMPESSVSSVSNLNGSKVKIGDSDLLPKELVESLDEERQRREDHLFKKELSRISNSTLKDLNKNLGDLKIMRKSVLEFEKSTFSEKSGTSSIVKNQSISVINISKNSANFFKDVEVQPDSFPFEMKFSKRDVLQTFKKKRKMAASFIHPDNKELNLNINLNLRLMKGENSTNFLKKSQNKQIKKLAEKKLSLHKAYNNPKNVFYKSRKSYNKFLGELSKALVNDKNKSESTTKNKKTQIFKKKTGRKKGKSVLTMIKKKNNLRKKLKESQKHQGKKKQRDFLKKSQEKKMTSLKIDGFYEALEKANRTKFKHSRKMSQRSKKRNKLRSFRPKHSQPTDRSISNLMNFTKTRKLKTARDMSQKSFKKENKLNSSLRRKYLGSKNKINFASKKTLLKKPQSVNKLKMSDLGIAIKKKKFSLQQHKIMNKELANKFSKTYNSAKFKILSKNMSKKQMKISKPAKNINRRSDHFMSMKGSKTSRSHYSKDKKAPLKILAEKLGMNLKGLKRFSKKPNSRLFSEQIKKSISNSRKKAFKSSLSYKEGNSMKRSIKEKKTKSNLISGSKFNLLMSREMKNSKIITSREKIEKPKQNKHKKSKTIRGGIRNLTMGYMGQNAFNNSRKSMNSVYEKNYIKRFQRAKLKKEGGHHLHSQSEVRPVIYSVTERRIKNRQSTLSSTRLSNAFQKSLKA